MTSNTANRGRLLVAASVAAVVVIGIVIAVAVVVTRGGGQAGPAGQAGQAGGPPWPVPSDPVAAIRAAGLTPAAGEGSAEHYHAHLDVIVDGKPVPVPADVGVAEAVQLISPLHTHDNTGVLHIESPRAGQPYYLGQFFQEWDVALSSGRIGRLQAGSGDTLTAYVNGRKVTGDPAKIQLAAHQEIALVYQPAGANVTAPSSYSFGAGL